MDAAECLIVIAAPTYDAARPVLDSLTEAGAEAPRFEVIVAVGANPPRQRNLAVARSQSPFILFLDSDCQMDANSRQAVESHLGREQADAVGGPVVLPEGSNRRQHWFQAALSHPAVVGPTASRYARRGVRREADERELILANLLVRRRLFEQSGGFNEALFPNEENEWMDRFETGTLMLYDPDMAVARPQRKTWGAFVWMLLRYGAGRVRQFKIDQRPNLKLLMPGFLVAWAAALAALPWLVGAASLAGALIYPLLLILSRPRHLRGPRNWIMIATAAILLHLSYAAGQLLGWLGWPWQERGGEEVRLYGRDGHDLDED